MVRFDDYVDEYDEFARADPEDDVKDTGVSKIETEFSNMNSTGKSSQSQAYTRTKSFGIKKENKVLMGMCKLMNELVIQMTSFKTAFSPYVGKVIGYLVKMIIGEENVLSSDLVLNHKLKDLTYNFFSSISFLRNDHLFKQEYLIFV